MEKQSVFDELDFNTKVRRRDLLPIWIKVFLWIFFFAGAIGVLSLIFGGFSSNIALSLYGFETNKVYTPVGLLIVSLFIFKGIVSYGLWFEQDWAIRAGKIDTFLGLIICGISMFVIPFFTKYFELRLEIVILIPYLLKLKKIEKNWLTL